MQKIKTRDYLVVKMKGSPELLYNVEQYADQLGIPVHTAIKSLLKRGLKTCERKKQ